MIEAPKFWSGPLGPRAIALWPFGLVYGLAVMFRAFITTAARIDIPVICIGNPTLGGAGKTPTALSVACILIEKGMKPHFLSRGYGGSFAGPVTVDPADHRADDVGDEPLLLAARAPAHIARDRVAGARLAAASGADIIVMDDGFQNPTLGKDLSVLVVDGAAGCGNGLVFPAGPLRAPLMWQIARADAVLIVGDGDAGDQVAKLASVSSIAVFRAKLRADTKARELAGRRVFAVSGIGRPEKFLTTLTELGVDIAGHRHFPDHHAYSAADITNLESLASSLHAETIVTTEKDLVKIDDRNDPGSRFRARLETVPVRIEFENPDGLNAMLDALLEQYQ